MVDLAMSIFEFLTKFLVFWHPWHPWVCIRSYLKPLFETDMNDSSYCVMDGPLSYAKSKKPKKKKKLCMKLSNLSDNYV